MRRLALTGAVLAAAVVVAIGASGAADGGGGSPRYHVVLDNAFGLIEGADLKVAGVRAGKVEALEVRPSDLRAQVTVSVDRPGFASFRSDVFCEVRPQSLIGEYFLDCDPGRSPRELPSGSTIPVTQTATTIPADLVANVLRRPYRERLRLILNELGLAVAARGPELNATIRRAVPALRETNQLLAVLDRNRRVIQRLTRDSDQVLLALAGNRGNVVRFVEEARDTAAVSASRRTALRATLRRLPTFLRELRPTLRDLGTAASQQTPALRDLRASAPSLNALLQRLGPFSRAAQPAIDSLGQASATGRKAVEPGRLTVAELRRFSEPAQEVATNLALVLEHLDDRRHAVESDPDSPGGRGYTGLEALLQYTFDQTLAINVFDERGYILKLNLVANECGHYTDGDGAREDPERTRRCTQALGPPIFPEEGVGQGGNASAALARRAAGQAGAAHAPDSDAALLDYLLAR